MNDLNQEITKNIDSLLKEDSMAVAEQVAGKSYKEDKNVAWLCMSLMQDKSKKLNALLETTGDSKFTNILEDYKEIITREGFIQVFKMDFYCEKWEKDDEYYIYFQPELGILLTFDTYGLEQGKKTINSAKIYYNWQPNNFNEYHNFTSSGGFDPIPPKTRDDAKWPDDYIWAGDHDAREAIRHKIGQLKENGQFITPWVKQPFLWLLNYNDIKDKNYNYKKINQERMYKLPIEVQKAIKGLTD